MGLYFPHFHFPSDEWVKVAALYWDRMYRIVPEDYETRRDTDAIKELASDDVFIDDVYPDPFDRERVQEHFRDMIEAHESELVKHYGIDRRDEWPEDEYTVEHAPTGTNPKLAYIYNEKVNHKLYDTLLDLRLGTKRSDVGSDTRWVGMHPKLANVYMAALAETMARRRALHPVAHDTINHFAVAGFTLERLTQVLLNDARIVPTTPTTNESEFILAKIAIKAVMPKDIAQVPVDKILHVREEHGGDLGRFQSFVKTIIAKCPELGKVTVPEFVYEHLQVEYDRQIKPLLDSFEDTMRSNGIDTVTNLLNMDVKMPAFLTGAGTLTGAAIGNPVLGATTAVALGLLKIIGDTRKQYKDALKASDVAYLIHIQEGLAPITSLKWFETRARKLVLGV